MLGSGEACREEGKPGLAVKGLGSGQEAVKTRIGAWGKERLGLMVWSKGRQI